MTKLPPILLIALALSLFSAFSKGQEQPASPSLRGVLESREAAEAKLQEHRAQGDALDMTTPMSSLLLLKDALDREDYEYAGQFLDMRYLPPELEGIQAEELLLQLRYVWGRQEILDIMNVSDHPDGRQNDGLPEFRDQIGEIELSSGRVPIYMQRVPDGKGGRVWKISNATVARIPEMWKELGYSPFVQKIREFLPEIRVLGMENWQALFVLLSIVIAWPVASLVCLLLARTLVKAQGPFQDALARFLRRNFRVFLFILLLRVLISDIGLTLYSKILLQSAGLFYIASIILFAGMIDLLHGYQSRRLVQSGNEHYVPLLRPVATVVKVLLVITIGLIWANESGYDMSTIVAGLGVGSLAVALAAQKTLENVIGAITIYSARPIKPGDFCRFGTTIGTVEEIGLRSTIIRTLNRTRVSIPNAVFAADEVENFSERDRIRYFRYLRLEIGDTEKMRALLFDLRKIFESDERVQTDTISIRFEKITDNTAQVRVDAAVSTNDFQVYLEVAEELNLRIIEAVRKAGARFSGPGHQLTLRAGGGLEGDDALARFLADQRPPPATS